MTPLELHDLLTPLWEKWPETKPDEVVKYSVASASVARPTRDKEVWWLFYPGDWPDWSGETVAALCIARMVEVLCQSQSIVAIGRLSPGAGAAWCAGNGKGATLIEALVSACFILHNYLHPPEGGDPHVRGSGQIGEPR